MTLYLIRWSCLLAALCLFAAPAQSAEKKQEDQQADEFIPELGTFPPHDKPGHHIAGELVVVDPINRRGGLRIDGDFVDDRYHRAPPHHFNLLPYGQVWYHGAPAELRDVPIGTHLHGYFYLPPEGDWSRPVPQPDNPQDKKYVPPYNHAWILEDDFSFYQRRGQAWKIKSVDLEEGKLHVVSTGKEAADGLTGEQTFEIDRSTRIWQGRSSVELEALAPDQEVQINLTWAPEWRNRVFHCSDVWIDEQSRDVAAERQRQIHLRHQHHYWLAGTIEHVEHQPNGQGIATITLFAGIDPSLYDEVREKRGGYTVAVAEPTLRTWWQDHDSKVGRTVEIIDLDNPPPGSSGLQLRLQFNELLEGYRPGRVVRLRCHDWPNYKLPPEFRIIWMHQTLE